MAKVTTLTLKESPIDTARAEVARLRGMRDELIRRVNELTAKTTDTTKTLTLDEALNVRRELFVARETLNDIHKATRDAEVAELKAIASDHHAKANECYGHAAQLNEVIKQDRSTVSRYLGDLRIDPMWSDTEIETITKAFTSLLKIGRNAAFSDYEALCHMNEANNFKQQAERLSREPLPLFKVPGPADA